MITQKPVQSNPIQFNSQQQKKKDTETRGNYESDLEIEEGRVGLAASELESAEEDADADADAVGEEEGLAEVADGVGNARRFVGGMVAAGRAMLRLVVVGRGAGGGGGGTGLALSALELLYGFAKTVLGFPEAALGVDVVLLWRRWWRPCC